MTTPTTTRSATKAKVLTMITVVAAGIAAYAVGTLAEQQLQTDGFLSRTYSQDQIRRSCVTTCELHGGVPCGTYVQAADQATCQVTVNSCIDTCPAAGTSTTYFSESGALRTLPQGRRGQAYRQRFAVNGYEYEAGGTWSVYKSALPAGLEIDPAGLLSGTPSLAGPYRFAALYIRPITDQRSAVRVIANVEIFIEEGNVAVVQGDAASGNVLPTEMAAGSYGGFAVNPLEFVTPVSDIRLPRNIYYELRMAVNGVEPSRLKWSVPVGSPPPGMKFEHGTLYGTPLEAGTFVFGVSYWTPEHVSAGYSYAQEVRVTVAGDGPVNMPARRLPIQNEKLGTSSNTGTSEVPEPGRALSFLPSNYLLPDASVGEDYSVPFSIVDPWNGSWNWSLSNVPAGMQFDPDTRVLSGRPTQTGTASMTLQAEKGADALSQVYTLVVSQPLTVIALTNKALPEGEVGVPYNEVLQATGGTGSYRWKFANTNVPTGWTLSEDGWLKNRNPREGVQEFLVRTEDRGSGLAQQSIVVVNIQQVVAMNTGSATGTTSEKKAPEGTVAVGDTSAEDEARKQALLDAQGTAPVSGSGTTTDPKVSGTTTTGTGTAAGTGTTAGTGATTGGTASTGTGTTTGTGSGTAQTTVGTTATTTITPVAFNDVGTYPEATIAVYYNARPFDVTGGTAPYRYALTSGSLPDGLSLNAIGAIEGTPSRAGTFNFVITLTDARNDTVRASRILQVRAATVTQASSGGSSSGQQGGGGGSGGGGGAVGSISVPNSEDAPTRARIDVLSRMNVRVHDLVKLQDDGDTNTQHDTTVYYVGADGRRHFFPNQKVYFTWYQDFSGVRIVSGGDLAQIPLGANATYRPGTRLVKIESEEKVYVVEGGRRLRWVRTEADARAIYGSSWNQQVDDVPVTFYTNYVIGMPIENAAAIRPSDLVSSVTWVSNVLP